MIGYFYYTPHFPESFREKWGVFCCDFEYLVDKLWQT